VGKIVSSVKDIFSGPDIPDPIPPPPIPKREDTENVEARKRQRQAQKLRKGRASTILNTGRGVEDNLGSVSRPAARSASLFGG